MTLFSKLFNKIVQTVSGKLGKKAVIVFVIFVIFVIFVLICGCCDGTHCYTDNDVVTAKAMLPDPSGGHQHYTITLNNAATYETSYERFVITRIGESVAATTCLCS